MVSSGAYVEGSPAPMSTMAAPTALAAAGFSAAVVAPVPSSAYQYVKLPAVNWYAGAISIELWFMPTGTTSTGLRLFYAGTGDNDDRNNLVLYTGDSVSNSQLDLNYQEYQGGGYGAAGRGWTSNYAFPLNVWTHVVVAASWANMQASFYANGSLVASSVISGSSLNGYVGASRPFAYIAKGHNTFVRPAIGVYAEYAVYSYALTATQVAKHYSAEHPSPPPPSPSPPPSPPPPRPPPPPPLPAACGSDQYLAAVQTDRPWCA